MKKQTIPEELRGVTKDGLDRLESKIDKCYSKDKYKDFQEDVKKISLDLIGSSDGRDKIKGHAKEAVKEYLAEQAWKEKTFWLPILMSLGAIAVALLK